MGAQGCPVVLQFWNAICCRPRTCVHPGSTSRRTVVHNGGFRPLSKICKGKKAAALGERKLSFDGLHPLNPINLRVPGATA